MSEDHCVDDVVDEEKSDIVNFELDEPCQVCGQKGDIVCLPCKKLLCYRCAFVAGHRDHTCKELSEAKEHLSTRVAQIVDMNKTKAQRLVDVAGQISEQYTFISTQIQADASKMIRKIQSRETEMLSAISGMRERAREVIEHEIDHYVANSSKPTTTTLDLIRSLVELEMAASTKKVIQLPQVNKIYVNFESLEHQVENLKLETRIEKREDDNNKELLHKPKKTSHHRLPLNHVFHQETKFFFKIDVLSATSGLSTSGNTVSVGIRTSSPIKEYETILADRPIELDLVYWEVNVSKSSTYKLGLAYRYVRPSRHQAGNMSQHSIADQWNCWSIR